MNDTVNIDAYFNIVKVRKAITEKKNTNYCEHKLF